VTALFQPQSLYPLIQRLRLIFQAQSREVVSRLSLRDVANGATAPDLSHWTKPMVEWLRPAMAPFWKQGLVKGRAQLLQIQSQPVARYVSRMVLRQRRKDLSIALNSPDMFSLHNPSVGEQLDRWTFEFCLETNKTAVEKLDIAFAKLRVQLNEGIEAGESYRDIAGRINQIFNDPTRANLIAITEVPRALNGGAIISYQKSGACEGSGWSTTSDPCPEICEPLDGEERPFGEPFVVLNKGPAVYRTVYHSPAHCRCLCVMVPVIAI